MTKNTIEQALEKQRQLQQQAQANKAESMQQSEIVETQVEQVETVSTSTSQPVPPSNPSQPTAAVANKQALNIPLARLEEEGYVALSGKRKLVNEEFRAIKRKVLNNAFGLLSSTIENSNLIMLTSATSGEGKSFSSINLALSIALEQDKTVLLVDCDVLKPSLHKKLHVENKLGIMEYLSGEVDDVQSIINPTNVEKLRFISAGKQHHLSTELLASQKMVSLANEFVNRYPDRIVILDCPPLLGINETYVLSELAGQILVVIEEGSTKLSSVKSAVEQLNKDKAIGFVVNKSTNNNYNEYGYGYGYGQGTPE